MINNRRRKASNLPDWFWEFDDLVEEITNIKALSEATNTAVKEQQRKEYQEDEEIYISI